MFEPDYEWLDDTPVLAETIAGLLCIEFFRSIDGGFLVGNYVKVVGGSGPVLVQIPMRSFGIPADEVSARTLGMAMESILEFDQSHVGVTVSRVSKRAWKQVSMRVTGKPESQWKRCCVTFNPHSGWTARSDVVSLRWSGDVDSRLNDVGTVVCPCGAGVEELGGMVLESYARVDAWCARNGRNPYTGMPCPLREDLGADGVLVLTPPAYFQEDYEPAPGVVRGYYHHVDAMALPQEPGSRWYGDWVRGLDAWLCWRVVPAGGADGLLGCGRLRMVVRWRCLRWGVRGSRVWGVFRRVVWCRIGRGRRIGFVGSWRPAACWSWCWMSNSPAAASAWPARLSRRGSVAPATPNSSRRTTLREHKHDAGAVRAER